jgi:hypothetical protein
MNATLEAMVRALFQSWFVDFDPVRAKLDGRTPVGLDPATASLFPSAFQDSQLGPIPKGWAAGTLGDTATNPRRGVQPGDIAPNTPYIALEHMPRRCISIGDWDIEHDSLADPYKVTDKTLRVRKLFQTKTKGADGKNAAGFIYGYKNDGTLSGEPFYGAKNVQSGKFGDLIYIPAVSKVDEHTKLTGPSALRDLLTDVMSDVVEGGKAYGVFAASVENFASTILSSRFITSCTFLN